MKWNNLKQNKCPKCGSPLEDGNGTDLIRCPKTNCFRIWKDRLNEISTNPQHNKR